MGSAWTRAGARPRGSCAPGDASAAPRLCSPTRRGAEGGPAALSPHRCSDLKVDSQKQRHPSGGVSVSSETVFELEGVELGADGKARADAVPPGGADEHGKLRSTSVSNARGRHQNRPPCLDQQLGSGRRPELRGAPLSTAGQRSGASEAGRALLCCRPQKRGGGATFWNILITEHTNME